jgi:hypothetical protein
MPLVVLYAVVDEFAMLSLTMASAWLCALKPDIADDNAPERLMSYSVTKLG